MCSDDTVQLHEQWHCKLLSCHLLRSSEPGCANMHSPIVIYHTKELQRLPKNGRTFPECRSLEIYVTKRANLQSCDEVQQLEPNKAHEHHSESLSQDARRHSGGGKQLGNLTTSLKKLEQQLEQKQLAPKQPHEQASQVPNARATPKGEP